MDKKKNIFASATNDKDLAFMLWGAVSAMTEVKKSTAAIKGIKQLLAEAEERKRQLYDEWYSQLDDYVKAQITYIYADSKPETEQEA